MPSYLISGPSGSGKSTVGRVLQQRGYRVIETDFEDGLSGWYEIPTGKKVTEMPPQPYTEEWIDSHAWWWDTDRMNALLQSVGDQIVFFCGGAYNERMFYKNFAKLFGLYTPKKQLVIRLQEREPERWVEGSVELKNGLAWNEKFREYCQKIGIPVIDSSQPPEKVADKILGYIK